MSELVNIHISVDMYHVLQVLQTAQNDMVTPVRDKFDEKDIDYNISYDNNNINNKTMQSNIIQLPRINQLCTGN